jgi:hypothetical protein
MKALQFFQKAISLTVIFLLSSMPLFLFAQTPYGEILDDFEDGGTHMVWDIRYGLEFDSSYANPKKEGINTSAKVAKALTDSTSNWPLFGHDYDAAGEDPIEFDEWIAYSMKVYTEVDSAYVLLKFEAANAYGAEVELPVEKGVWQELVFVFNDTMWSEYDTNPLIKMIIFPDFIGPLGDRPRHAADWYFDDITRWDGIPSLAVGDNVKIIPVKFNLEQNYPNPFNPSTTINYSLESGGFVKLSVYNFLGQEVKTLVNQYQNAGSYTYTFNALNLPSGVYMYKLKANNSSHVKKMILMK